MLGTADAVRALEKTGCFGQPTLPTSCSKPCDEVLVRKPAASKIVGPGMGDQTSIGIPGPIICIPAVADRSGLGEGYREVGCLPVASEGETRGNMRACLPSSTNKKDTPDPIICIYQPLRNFLPSRKPRSSGVASDRAGGVVGGPVSLPRSPCRHRSVSPPPPRAHKLQYSNNSSRDMGTVPSVAAGPISEARLPGALLRMTLGAAD